MSASMQPEILNLKSSDRLIFQQISWHVRFLERKYMFCQQVLCFQVYGICQQCFAWTEPRDWNGNSARPGDTNWEDMKWKNNIQKTSPVYTYKTDTLQCNHLYMCHPYHPCVVYNHRMQLIIPYMDGICHILCTYDSSSATASRESFCFPGTTDATR